MIILFHVFSFDSHILSLYKKFIFRATKRLSKSVFASIVVEAPDKDLSNRIENKDRNSILHGIIAAILSAKIHGQK